MDWLFGIATAMVVLALVPGFLLLLASRRFRALAGAVIFLVVVVGIVVYFRAANEDRLSHSRIPSSQIALENLNVDSKFGNYHLSGTVKNNSTKFTLQYMTLEIIARDCLGRTKPENCKIIGDDKENVYVDALPGQSQDLDTYVDFPAGDIKPKGRLAWDYSIVDTFV